MARVAIGFTDLRERRALAPRLIDGVPESLRVSADKAYVALGTGTLPGTDEIVSYCRDVYARCQREGTLPTAQFNKPSDYQYDLLEVTDSQSHVKLIEFATHPLIIGITASYLGEVPALRTIRLMWTPVNEKLGSSQLLHLDIGMDKQIKFCFNVWDVDESCGPMSFLPAEVSRRITHALDYSGGKLSDEQVYTHCDPNTLIEIIGPPGTGAAVDTSCCFHFGGRSRKKERLVLRINYASAFSPMMRRKSWIEGHCWGLSDKMANLVLFE